MAADATGTHAPRPAEPGAGMTLRAVLIGIAVLVALWIASTVALVLLLGFSALIIAIALNGPVTWFERRGVPRLAGTLGLLLVFAGVATGAAVIVGSQLVD